MTLPRVVLDSHWAVWLEGQLRPPAATRGPVDAAEYRAALDSLPMNNPGAPAPALEVMSALFLFTPPGQPAHPPRVVDSEELCVWSVDGDGNTLETISFRRSYMAPSILFTEERDMRRPLNRPVPEQIRYFDGPHQARVAAPLALEWARVYDHHSVRASMARRAC